MRIAFSLLGLTAWSSLATFGVAKSFTRCGSEASESFRNVAAKVADEEASGALRKAQDSIEVDTYFHVVAATDSHDVQKGYITDKMLDDQLKVLNKAYEPHRIKYNLLKTTRTVNSDWATIEYEFQDVEMKRALRQGDYKSLNVYFVADLGTVLGYATFPEHVREESEEFIRDGCVVIGGSVPGGTTKHYNGGATLIHEVGHFHGLLHTFENGCWGSDYVDDTPPQGKETEGCPKRKDTCPTRPGDDPIHNYMDYSTDICLTEFTAGQEKRMFNMWERYRTDK